MLEIYLVNTRDKSAIRGCVHVGVNVDIKLVSG